MCIDSSKPEYLHKGFLADTDTIVRVNVLQKSAIIKNLTVTIKLGEVLYVMYIFIKVQRAIFNFQKIISMTCPGLNI